MYRFKGIIVFALSVLMLAQAGIKTGIVIYYYANKAYIAQNLCEQRDKPKSCCAGSCQVKKWLNNVEEDGSQQKAPAGPKQNKIQEIVLFCEPVQVLEWAFLPSESQQTEIPAWAGNIPPAPVSDIFHPPS